jgi:thioesterase domain-containing protein/aryl carrier-like protein
VNVVDNVLALSEQDLDVTMINTVPSVMRQLLKAGKVPDTVRVVNLAGETLKQDLVKSIFESSSVQTVCNLYGPSETTTYSTWNVMSRKLGFESHIGRPIANTRIYILDSNLQLLPIGVTGEIFIGGAGVARGYYNHSELTHERFLPDPFVEATKQEPNPRMYKTGDLGRFLPDGTIEYLGRNDVQLKLRGYRIEPGEIEACLCELEHVNDAVVLARKDSPFDERLIAYYTGSDSLAYETMRSHVTHKLPGYMVPAVFIHLADLPLTPNGKLDRKALPAPEGKAFNNKAYGEPQGELEQTMAAVWSELLNLKQVGRYDDFFDLGGHSLLAVQMASLLKQAGIDVQLPILFTHTTIERLAATIENEDHAALPYGAVALRRSQSGTPLFMVHDVSGDVLYAERLLRYIDEDIPVYGLVDTPLGEAALRTMHARARRLIQIIRTVQPAGPYRIAGYSFGGSLAYEIATQLLGEDEPVEFLGLIDAFNFSEISMKPQLELNDTTLLLNFVLQTAGGNAMSLQKQLEREAKTADLQNFVETCREKRLLPQHMSMEAVEHYLVRMKASANALEDYHPLSVPISLHLFKAMDERENTPFYQDEYLGWNQVVPESQIHVVPVPGTHVSLMQAPQNENLGKALSTALSQPGGNKKPSPALKGSHLFTLQARNCLPLIDCRSDTCRN